MNSDEPHQTGGTSAHALFAGPGELKALCRKLDWSATSLGVVKAWPQGARTAVQLCLDAPFPMAVYLGSELLTIFNDSCRAVFGEALEPAMLGRPAREVWGSCWEQLRPEFERVTRDGESTYSENQPFAAHRRGREEWVSFIYSLVPVKDGTGQPLGVMAAFHETTESTRVKRSEEALRANEAQQVFLLRLSDVLRTQTDPLKIQAAAIRLLGEHLMANRVFYSEYDEHTGYGTIQREYVRAGEAPIAGCANLAGFPLSLEALRTGQPLVVADVQTLPAGERSRYRKLNMDALVSVPLVEHDRLVALLTVSAAEPRSWSALEVSLVQETAQRTWSAVERARAERALRISEGRYRTLFESIDEGFCLIDVKFGDEGTALDYRFLEVNPAFAKHTGIESAVGRWMRDIAPKHEEHWFRTYGRVATTGESVRFEKEAEALGRVFDVYAFRVEDGGQRRVAILLNDVTERKKTVEALRRSEERFRALVTATSDAVYQMSPDWGVMRQLSGRGFIADIEVPTESWLQKYISAEDQAHVMAAIQEAIRTKDTFELEHRIRRLDGSLGWTFSRAIPVLNDDGEITEWFGAASDVTERRQVEEQLRESDRRKDEFLAMLGHELRNPLSAIRHATELLKLSAPHEERLQRAYGVLERQSLHMTRLIDGLLDVSRIARGKISLTRETLDVCAVVKSVVQDHVSRIDARGLTVNEDLPEDPLWIRGDRVRVAQILDNIVGNAVKFTDAPGRIDIYVSHGELEAIIRVRDTGIGIRPEAIRHLFEPFHQETQDIARAAGGLGLGLALARGLVELHGGRIKAQSEGLGRGTAFEVRLPLSAAPASETPVPVEEKERRSVDQRRILIIEDNKDTGQALSDLLELLGHEVMVIPSGTKAVTALKRHGADVVLCDLGLPGMSGYDVVRAIREDAFLRDIPLIALTGYGQPEDRRRTAKAGFDDHLTKPVDLAALNEMLERFGHRLA